MPRDPHAKPDPLDALRMPERITDLRARNLAVQFVTDCVGAAESDGFQDYEQTDWADQNPEVGDVSACGFTVYMAGHAIKFSAKIARTASGRRSYGF